MQRSGLGAVPRSVQLGFTGLLSLIASGYIGLFYLIALRRFRYADQLEWLEGGVLDAVRRVLLHQPVYVAPSSIFIPYIYTPGYYYLSALLCRAMGTSFAPLRLVSILATTGCLVLSFSFVRRNTGSSFCGLLSAGLFAALYAQTNGWFDLARVDMLSLLFLLAGIFAAQQGSTILAAVAFAVAFQTKQSAAGVAVLVLAHEFQRPRRLVLGLGLFAFLAGGSSWWLNHVSGGWYQYYTYFLPSHHSWTSHKLASFFLRDLIDPLGMTLGMIALAAMLRFARDREEPAMLRSRQTHFLIMTSAGVVLTSLAARLHLGGTANVSLPAFAWVCILFGLAIHSLGSAADLAPARSAFALRLAVLTAGCLQFAQLVYSPAPFIPTAAQAAVAIRLQQDVAKIDGPVFVVHNVIDGGLSGKIETANSMAIWDVLRADKGPAAANLRADLVRAFQEKRYAQVISDRSLSDLTVEEIGFLEEIAQAAAAAYPVERRLLTPPDSAQYYESTTTGVIKPNFVYSPGGSGRGLPQN